MAVHHQVSGPAQYGTTAPTLRCTKGDGKPGVSRRMPGAGLSLWRPGRPRLTGQPSSRTGENPPYGMSGGIEETSASFEARSAPRSYPTRAPNWRPTDHSPDPEMVEGGCAGRGPLDRDNGGYPARISGHSSHDGAKLPFDLAVMIPRDRLRPHYGDGFLGAPLLLCRPSKMRWPDHGGADATAQDKSPNPQGPGEP